MGGDTFFFDHGVTMLLFNVFFVFGLMSVSVASAAPVFWNECYEKGGVRVFLENCECVDGVRFDPRQVDANYRCEGVGSELYYRMLNAGQIDRTGHVAPNVVELFQSSTFKLNRECEMVWEAACYSPRTSSCVCRNSYQIPITEVWPNTRNCYGKYVSYGLVSVADQNPVKRDGDFDGIVEVSAAEDQCRFIYGEDVDGIACATMKHHGNIVDLTLDYSNLALSSPPSCHFNVIGRQNSGLYVYQIDSNRVVVRYISKTPGGPDPFPEDCRAGSFYQKSLLNLMDEKTSGGELISVFCAISG